MCCPTRKSLFLPHITGQRGQRELCPIPSFRDPCQRKRRHPRSYLPPPGGDASLPLASGPTQIPAETRVRKRVLVWRAGGGVPGAPRQPLRRPGTGTNGSLPQGRPVHLRRLRKSLLLLSLPSCPSRLPFGVGPLHRKLAAFTETEMPESYFSHHGGWAL